MPPILKKILVMVFTVIGGFTVVVGVVSLQLREVSSRVKDAGELQIPLFRAAVSVNQSSGELESLVAKSFLSLNQAELDTTSKQAMAALERLKASVNDLQGPRFTPIHSQALGLVGGAEQAGTGESRPGNLGVLLTTLATNSSQLAEAVQRTLQLAEDQLSSRRALALAREELSKVFRSGMRLAKVNEAGYSSLSRAVLTVLHASSARDLNYVGRSKFKEGYEALLKSSATAEDKALLETISKQFNKAFELAFTASASTADFTFFESRMKLIRKETALLREFADRAFEEGQSMVSSKTAATVRQSVILSVLTVVLGTLIALVLARSITLKIAKVVADLRKSAEQVGDASSQMFANSTTLSEGASTQAASLQETGASLCEMASMTKQTSLNAQRAKELSTDTRATAEAGAKHIIDMENAMRDIKESSDSIVKIVKSIDELAFQTNILALNAAVEAARAGQAGRGFAVVANEVRSLAQRSAAAAQDTSIKIQNSIQKSERGVRISSTVSASLEAIMAKAKSMDDLISEIAAASSEQHNGIGQINSAVQQIDKITQTSAGSADETTRSANELRGQAEQLKGSVQQLVTLVGDVKQDRMPGSAHARTQVANGSKESAEMLVIHQDGVEKPSNGSRGNHNAPGFSEQELETTGAHTDRDFKNF